MGHRPRGRSDKDAPGGEQPAQRCRGTGNVHEAGTARSSGAGVAGEITEIQVGVGG